MTPPLPAKLSQENLRNSLAVLLEASEYANQLGKNKWEFAVELECLRHADISNSDLRWLFFQELVEHRCEVTKAGDRHRVFAPETSLKIDDTTCVVLTTEGEAVAQRLGESRIEVPSWDDSRSELRWGEIVVKSYRLPSRNQQTVLRAFEEDGWPPRIDDPLPQVPEIDPKRRLGDTIKSLNRKQKRPLLKFMGDGSGSGVMWEPLPV